MLGVTAKYSKGPLVLRGTKNIYFSMGYHAS